MSRQQNFKKWLQGGLTEALKEDELEKLREVDQVNSPFTVNIIEGRNDELLIESAVRNIPVNQTEKEKLRERLQQSELVMGTVFGRNLKAVNIAVILAEDFDDAEIDRIFVGLILGVYLHTREGVGSMFLLPEQLFRVMKLLLIDAF